MILNSLIGVLHHKEDLNGYKLDMAYVTPQFIAAAMPTDRFMQGFYRMSSSMVAQYLENKHSGHWHVWNLQEDHELGYNPDNFGGLESPELVSRYPIPDHQTTTLAALIRLVSEIRSFIEQDPQNVALVHCKCGKGRTGTVAVAYLMMFHGLSYERAAEEFTQKRIRLAIVKGVTIQSQQRLLRYLSSWMVQNRDMSLLDTTPNIKIVQLIIRNPVIDSFELKLRPLEKAPQYAEEELSQWDITYRDKYYILRPLATGGASSSSGFPPDIWMEFYGYQSRLGYKVPMCFVSYGFNINMEPNELVESPHIEIDRASIHSVPISLSSSVFSKSGAPSGCFTCLWDDFDGVSGLDIKGRKAFDSIEVFWTRAEHASIGTSTSTRTTSSVPPPHLLNSPPFSSKPPPTTNEHVLSRIDELTNEPQNTAFSPSQFD